MTKSGGKMSEIEKEIKKNMKLQGYTLSSLGIELGKRTGKPSTPAAMKYKLDKGGLKLIELIEICDILGYEVGVTPKEEGRGSYCI